MSSLVSVMVPVFNARSTLPWALGSLLSQTYPHWECIVVDDGSTDHPEEVLAKRPDARIRMIRLEKNRGRAFARQSALEAAKGESLCMLDADDWYYPWKLEKQVQELNRHPDAALISSSMSALDREGGLSRIQAVAPGGASLVVPPLATPRTLPILFASCMIRMSVAKAHRFDTRFDPAEDFPYLLGILLKHSFLVNGSPLYAYSEVETKSLSKVLLRLKANARTFLDYSGSHPSPTLINLLGCAFRAGAYPALYGLGLRDWTIRRRGNLPSEADLRTFEEARSRVRDYATDFLR